MVNSIREYCVHIDHDSNNSTETEWVWAYSAEDAYFQVWVLQALDKNRYKYITKIEPKG